MSMDMSSDLSEVMDSSNEFQYSSEENYGSSGWSATESESSKSRILQSRCRSEKKRRDKLNLFIADLRSMLSLREQPTKKFDKCTVLRMTVDFLKVHNDFTVNINEDGKLNKSIFLPCDELGQLMLEVMNGFLLVINEDSKFVYVAEVVEKVLGVKATSLIGETVQSIVHEDDQQKITDELMNEILNSENLTHHNSSFIDQSENEERNTVLLTFRILVKKESKQEYRNLSCTGKWQQIEHLAQTVSSTGGKVLVLLGCLESEDLNEVVPSSSEPIFFLSKLSLDGSFIFVDTNSPQIIGYVPYELLGQSIYSFVHIDDLSDLCTAHRQVNEANSGEPVAVYFRFQSKGEDWLLFKAECNLVFKQNMKPDYISVKFILAGENELFHFRHFAKSKVNLIESSVNAYQEPRDQDITNSTQSFIIARDEKGESNHQPLVSSPICSGPSPSSATSSVSVWNTSPQQDEQQNDLQEEEEEDDQTSEKFFEAQKHLHLQLEGKHSLLLKSFDKQNTQLDNISKVMAEYAYFMEAPSFKNHYQQQMEMFKYFQYILKKQQRQQDYLYKQLQGKVKELEIRQRAVKLREMASQQQKTLTKINEMKQLNKHQKNIRSYESTSSIDVTSSSMNPIYVISSNNLPKMSRIPMFDDNNDNNNKNKPEDYDKRRSENITISTATMTKSSMEPSIMLQTQSQNNQESLENTNWNHMQHSSSNTRHLNATSGPSQNSSLFEMFQFQNVQPQRIQPQQFANQQMSLPPDVQQQNLTSSSQQTMLMKTLVSLAQTQNLTETPVKPPTATVSPQPPYGEGQSGDLQSVLSNQILVHLQVLQKHVLNQLQAVIQCKKNETTADFGQILPVLTQLQHLQQSIIEQETQQKQLQQAQQPRANVSINTSSKTSPLQNTSLQYLPESFDTTNNQNIEKMLLNNLNSSNPALINASQALLSNLASDNSINSSQQQDNEPSSSGSQSMFGDLDTRQKELNRIKHAFSYEEDLKDPDCFSNISSPDLRYLMLSNGTERSGGERDGANNDDDDEKKTTEDESNLHTFQPLLENQQQLAQMQQYQRMQIFTKQQEQLALIQTEQDIQVTQTSQPVQQTEPQSSIAMATDQQLQQPRQSQPPQQQQQQQPPQQQPPQQQQQQQPPQQQQQSAEPSSSMQGANASELNFLQQAFPGGNFSANVTNWMGPGNEEVLNMLFSENDFFW